MKNCLVVLAACALPLAAEESYRKPPKEILDVLNAPPTPTASANPGGTAVIFAQPLV